MRIKNLKGETRRQIEASTEKCYYIDTKLLLAANEPVCSTANEPASLSFRF